MGTVAFDNSGTLSEPTVVATDLADGYEWATPVPKAPLREGRIALISIGHDHVDSMRVDEPVGPRIDSENVPTHLALANTDVTPQEAREALLSDQRTPASVVPDHVARALSASPDRGTSVAGAQFVVDVDAGRAVKVFGYTVTPLESAPVAVRWAERNGFEPHIVSGDAEPVLYSVAGTVGIPKANVHAYQSPADKRRTVESLPGPVVMIGDYVNDLAAFEAADGSILIESGDDPDERLRDAADALVPGLADLPSAVELRELLGGSV